MVISGQKGHFGSFQAILGQNRSIQSISTQFQPVFNHFRDILQNHLVANVFVGYCGVLRDLTVLRILIVLVSEIGC